MEDFGLWLLRQRKAVRTIRQYGRSLERAEAWLREHRRKGLRRASWKDLRDYGETLPYSYASRQALVSAVKAYWRFIGRGDCPAWGVACPKKPRMRPRPVPRDELDGVFAAARSRGTRVYALVCCLYYMGLRREEAARLRWDQFRGDGRCRVVGKGAVEEDVPVHPEVIRALAALAREGDHVFGGRWGGHIAPGTVNHWVTVIAEIAGVDMHPHRFRHTAITNGYTETRDVFAVQAFARHADPRTTRGYTLVPWAHVEAVVATL